MKYFDQLQNLVGEVMENQYSKSLEEIFAEEGLDQEVLDNFVVDYCDRKDEFEVCLFDGYITGGKELTEEVYNDIIEFMERTK